MADAITELTRVNFLCNPNNPTATEVTALVETPKEIQKRYRLSAAVTVPAGTCVRLDF